jgi:hypothetical protein
MAVPEITHDNQVYSQNRLESLLTVAANEESYKQFLSDVETQGLEKTIDSLLFNQFLQKAQLQLTEEEFAKLIELGKDPDIAEQILLNEKNILDIIFNKQPIDPLLDSIDKIKNFLGEAEAGLSNNIFNALSNNYLTHSAQALIKAIGSHISSIQTLINENINPDMMMAIFAQLDGLLEYGASGRTPLPFYRPPSGDPDWGGMPGGGSSWEGKAPTNHSESSPMFIGLNLTDIEWIAK